MLSHVARNGVISVVMADDTNQMEIASRGEMLSCLRRKLPDIMVGNATISTKWNNKLAYGGLSRGGEAAVMATGIDAELDAKMDPTPPAPPPAAVISLAPTVHCADNTDSCGYGMDTNESKRGLLKDGTTPAFLVLEGSRDGDATGGGISLHDFASAEGIKDPSANAMIKAMMWAFNVPHLDWEGVAGTRGELLGRTYAVAFLHWHLNGVASHRSLFTGTTVTPCIANPGNCGYKFEKPSLFPQFREGGTTYGGHRQVVRYFRNELDTNEGTGPVVDSANAMLVVSSKDDSPPKENFRGRSVELTATLMEPASIELRLDMADVDNPAPLDSLAGSLSTLSFRLSKLLDSPIPADDNTPNGADLSCNQYIMGKNLSDLVARVTLFDADDGASPALASDDFRGIAAPDIGVELLDNDYSCDVTDFWTTVRIPLAEFQGVDLKRLERVRFELLTPDNGNADVRALLDSVELVGHVSEPVCGNGAQESGEQCDGPDLDGFVCEDLGLISGVLACKDTCEFDTSGCEMPPVCGNGLRELGEQCDGPDLGGSTCEDLDFVSGTLACTNACEFDTSDCEQDDGDCPEGAPGCPGGPCLDIPTSMGVAAYYQNGKYCNDPNYICREDFQDVWTCHECSPIDSGEGCPCLPNSLECPPELTCVHNLPDLPNIDVAARGACWAAIPPGYCAETCAATARFCGSTMGAAPICLIDECGPEFCEFEPGAMVCDRNIPECVDACHDFNNPCPDDLVCTTWGECWGP